MARPDPIVLVPPKLHAGQKRVANDAARYRVVSCGRRWGKTRVGTYIATRRFLNGGRVWWIAPTYQMALLGWREIRFFLGQIPRVHIAESSRSASIGRGILSVRSADDPNSLRGEGLDLAVFDEAAFIDSDAWTHAIRPSLSDREGRALFLSTPNGRNWFHGLYQTALNDTKGEWKCWTEPTSANPFINAEEIEAARKTLPERIFRQEYLAAFIEDGGEVFRNVRAAVTLKDPQPPQRGHVYVVGADWGKLEDFTVFTVVDQTTRTIVRKDRYQQLDYAFQRRRLEVLFEEYRPIVIVAERNSIGEPIIEELRRSGLPVQAFTTTNATKAEVIDSLALAIETKSIGLLDDETLISELESFACERLPSGLMRYSSPSGAHDDCVISAALAWYGAQENSPVSATTVQIRRPATRGF